MATSTAKESTAVGGLLPGRRPRDSNGLSRFSFPGEHGHGLGILVVVLRLLDQRLQIHIAAHATDHRCNLPPVVLLGFGARPYHVHDALRIPLHLQILIVLYVRASYSAGWTTVISSSRFLVH